MADAAKYAEWIVANQDKKGTPEFDTVAKAYQAAKQAPTTIPDVPKAPSNPYSFSNMAGAAVEPNLHLASGALAAPLSGIAGIAGSILPGESGQGARWTNTVGNALTYQPKTSGGQIATNAVTAPLRAIGQGANWAGEKTTDITGSPLAGTLVNTGLQGAAAYLGGKVLKTGEEPSVLPSAAQRVLEAPAAPVKWAAKTIGNMTNIIGAAFGHEGSVGRIASDWAKLSAGDSRAQIVDALRNAQTHVPGASPTVAEAIAEPQIGHPSQFGGATIRLQRDLTGVKGAEDVLPAKNRATQIALELQKGNVTSETGPMRETALRRATDIGRISAALRQRVAERTSEASLASEQVRRIGHAGEIAETVSQSGKPTLGSLPPQENIGMPRISGRYSQAADLADVADRVTTDAAAQSLQRGAEARFAKMQEESIGAHGLIPLSAKSITSKIAGTLEVPGIRASDVAQKTLGAVKEKIASLEDANGRIDANDLYTVRKEVGNTIRRFSTETANWDKRLSAKLEIGVQNAIDDAIENAGGSGWRDYLNSYSKGMKGIEATQARIAEAKKIGASVKSSANLLGGELPTPPTLLSRPMMLLNYGLKQFTGGAQTPVAKRLATAMTNPADYAALLREAQANPQLEQMLTTARAAALANVLRQQGQQ